MAKMNPGWPLLVALTLLCGGVARADEVAAAAPVPVATPEAISQAIVHHVPPAEAKEREPLRLAAAVENAWAETALVVRYRAVSAAQEAAFAEVPFERSSTGAYYAVIPVAGVVRPGLVYYVVGIAKDGREVAHFASAAAPHEVRVEPSTGLRWIEAEKRRLGGRYDRVHAYFDAISFGNELGEADYYYRSEIDWTHRVVTALYSFSLGYGFIQGETPSLRNPDDPRFVERGSRYGFGSIRLRANEKLWFDVGVLLGFSHDGFAPGVRAGITLGRDWRTCVQAGGEIVADLGNTWWIQLKWDTVPPFLMSARITSTELPGSALEGGASLSVHADYPLTSRINLGAKLSMNARERRPASVGGGLAVSVEF